MPCRKRDTQQAPTDPRFSVRQAFPRISVNLRKVVLGLIAVVFCAALGSATSAAETVRVRGGEHEGFARLVFDWPRPVSYEAAIDQQRLVLTFGEAAQFDVGVLRYDLEDYIEAGSVRQQAATISFGLKHPLGLKHFTLGPKVVIDLVNRDGALETPQAAKTAVPAMQTELPSVRLRVGDHPTFDRLVFDWPQDVAYRILGAAPNPTIAFSTAGRLDTKRFRDRPPRRIPALEVMPAAGNLTVGLRIASNATLRHYRDGGQVVVDVVDPILADRENDAPASASRGESGQVSPARKVARNPEKMDFGPRYTLGSRQAAYRGTAAVELPLPLLGEDPAMITEPPEHAIEDPVQGRREVERQASIGEQLFDRLVPLVTMAGPADDETKPDQENPAKEDKGPERAMTARPFAGDEPATGAPAAASNGLALEPSDMVLGFDTPLELLPEDLAGLWRDELSKEPEARPRLQPEPMPDLQLPAELAGLAAAGEGEDQTSTPSLVVTQETAAGPDDAASVTADTVEALDSVLDWMPIPGRNLRPDPPVALAFNWSAKTALASFRRGPYLWFVFDRQSDQAIADRIAEVVPGLGSVERLKSPGATVIRVMSPLPVVPRMSKNKISWKIDLRARASRPEHAIGHEISGSGRQRLARLEVGQASRVIEIVDPEYGDKLYVIPVGQAGLGVEERLRLPEFEALATFQGVALRAVGEDLRVRLRDSALEVSTDRGLIASQTVLVDDRGRRPPPPILGQRLFDLPGWRIAPDALSNNHRQKLLNAIKDAKGPALSRARLEMTRFYFAHGLGLEARAAVELIENTDQGLSRDPEFLLMKAASLFLVENYEAARELLADPILAQEWEALPWQAAIAAVAQEWDFAAMAFQRSEALFDDYVQPVRDRLRLLAAEARIAIEDSEGADFYLEQVRQQRFGRSVQAQIDFLEAKRRLLEHRVSTARVLLKSVAAGPHPASRTRARLALIDLDLEGEAPDYAAIAAELDRMRYAWRGDAFEFALQRRLAELRYQQGKYRKTLAMLNEIVLQSPDEIIARQADLRMREIFKDLYLGEPKDDLAPVTALALYEEYRDLAPDGKDGRKTVDSLIDRLIGVDLLDRAAALLEEEIQFELDGEDKAKAGAKLAMVRLQAELPRRALDALDASEIAEAPEALRQGRQFLRARALAALDRSDEALALLASDTSEASLRHQCEILWDREDWPRAADLLEAIVLSEPPPEGGLSDQAAEDLTRLAVAYTMSGNRAGLLDLDTRFGATMLDAPNGRAFALLTSDLDRQEVRSIADELAGAARIQTYLSEMRESL